MTPADLSVAGRIYRKGRLARGVLFVDTATGRITKVARHGRAAEHHDFGTRAILPGAIDCHVHFRDPGATHKEDIKTGSGAAACGGVTGFVDMPNTTPATITMRALRDKLRLMAERAVVDYAAWSGATWYLEDLPEMMEWSPGVKLYLGATTGDLLADDRERVKQVLRIAGKAGKAVVLHAEAERVLQQFRGSPAGLPDHDRTRPAAAEVEAIYDIMKALPGLDSAPQIHVAHVSSVEALQAATAARFGAGVCPHHLLLDTTACAGQPSLGKMNPPLRGPDARQALWDAFAAGRFQVVESDHAPHTRAEKAEPFAKAPAGVPGVETMLPLLLARAAAGDVPLATVVDAATEAPCRLLGIKDRGALVARRRADFAVYDLEAPARLDASRLHSKCGWTPYEGMQAVMPSHTFLAGRPVVEEGEVVAKPGSAAPLVPLPEDP